MFKSFFGDKFFYKKVMALALPIMLQNGITNLVNMLDNLMVGSLNIASSSGVTIANQLIFVYNLCIFGAISGAGIFGAQFFGKGDQKGLKYAFRFKLLISIIISFVGVGIFCFMSDPLISIYLQEGGEIDPALVFKEAKDYLMIMLIGLVPFALSQCYSGTLRECSRPTLPMVSGLIAVFVNLIFNYILIFGHFGAPALGVRGAAIATVISRFTELLITVVFAHIKAGKATAFLNSAYKSLYIPLGLTGSILLKTLPLMANELVWATGMAAINKFYSERGIEVIAANNVLQTFFNVFSVAFMAVGMSLGILLGQKLGETTDKKTVLSYCKKLITTSVLVGTVMGIIFFALSGVIPNLYNYPQNVRDIATKLLIICAVMMPIEAFSHSTYFTLRSGGKTLITFLFDSGYVWAIDVVAAMLLVRFTTLDIITVYLIVQILNALRCILGFIFVKRGSWIRNIVE